MEKTDGRKLGESRLQIKRNQVVKIYRSNGGNAAETARQLGVSRYFVIKWIKRYREQWEEAVKNGMSTKCIYLYPKKRGRRVKEGRKAKTSYLGISWKIKNTAIKTIEENAPNQVGINSLLWTERAVKKLFKLKYNKNISNDEVYEFIRNLVFSRNRNKYRKIKKTTIKSYNGYGSVITNGYIYFLRKPKYTLNYEWYFDIKKLYLKQRKQRL